MLADKNLFCYAFKKSKCLSLSLKAYLKSKLRYTQRKQALVSEGCVTTVHFPNRKSNAVQHVQFNAVQHVQSNAVQPVQSNAVQHVQSNAVQPVQFNAVQHVQSNVVQPVQFNAVQHVQSNAVQHVQFNVSLRMWERSGCFSFFFRLLFEFAFLKIEVGMRRQVCTSFCSYVFLH